jgi:hypothetical protein
VTVIAAGSGGFLDDTIRRVKAWDDSRPRSLQADPGWSEVGGCRSALGFKLSGAWESDETDGWAATRGTAIHKLMEEVLAGVPGVRTEVTTSYRGIPGHADLVVIDESGVADWKTTKLANSLLWRSDETVLWEKRVQAQGYAAGLIDAGELGEDAKVRLVVIPADGTYADWWMWEESFDRSVADWGADRLDSVRRSLAAGEPLPKDKRITYCQVWCPFFSLCRAGDEPGDEDLITDPEAVAAVAAYAQAREEETAAKRRKDALAAEVRGLQGIAGEYRVGLSREGDKKLVLDENWIRADYAARGEQVPQVWTTGRAPSLNVTRIRKAAAK